MRAEGGAGIADYFFQEFGPPEAGSITFGPSSAGASGSPFPATADRPADDFRQPLF
jgi:hypothetical protein